MNVQELNNQLKGKIEAAKALSAQFTPETMPKEVTEKIDVLLGEADQLRDEVKRAERIESLDKFMDEPVEAKAAPLGREVGRVEVVKDESEHDFATAGEFFMAVKNAALYPGKADVRLRSRKATGLSEGVPADGGYLLSPQVSGRIVDRMYNVGQLLSRVGVLNLGANTNSMLINGIDETSRAVSGSRYGGVLGYWLGEGATKSASKPAFRQIELKLKKVAALCVATDELLEDTTALESWLMQTAPEELRFQVEAAIYRGDGVGKPLGIMNSPCLVSPLRIDANEIDATDIANLWARRWAGASDYVWLVNQAVFPQLINLVVGNFPLLAINGIQGAPFATMYGRPVIESEYCSALGTTGDIMLASLSSYQTIQRGGIKSDSSIHVYFTTDETAFRFVYRIDGQPLWHSALTPYQGSATQSPFVVLATASV